MSTELITHLELTQLVLLQSSIDQSSDGQQINMNPHQFDSSLQAGLLRDYFG